MIKVVNSTTRATSGSQMLIIFQFFPSDSASVNLRLALRDNLSAQSYLRKTEKLCYKTNGKHLTCATIKLWMYAKRLLLVN